MTNQADQENVTESVRHLLLTDNRCRNSDLWLVIEFWRNVNGASFFIDYDNMHKLTPLESITRARRKIQEDVPNLRATSPDVRSKRRQKQREFTDFYGANQYYESGPF